MDNELAASFKKTVIPVEMLEKVKGDAEEHYRQLKSVICPYFEKEVAFNSKGLNHIKFKGWQRARSVNEQYVRLKLLPLVPIALSRSATLQGYAVQEKKIRKKNFGTWGEIFQKIFYYEFIYVHKEKVRIKVIVRKDGHGEYYFYSVIPFWKMGGERKKLFEGNPEED